MLPVKWKLYRIFTYAQLAYSCLWLVWLIWQMINIPYPPEDPWIPFLVGIIFLFMILNPVINIILLIRNFPDKSLTGSRKTLYIISLVLNTITVIGLAFGTIAGFVAESEDNSSEDKTGVIILTILSFITLVNLFLLICQFGINNYLKKNSTSSLRSLIDSIGDPDPRTL